MVGGTFKLQVVASLLDSRSIKVQLRLLVVVSSTTLLAGLFAFDLLTLSAQISARLASRLVPAWETRQSGVRATRAGAPSFAFFAKGGIR